MYTRLGTSNEFAEHQRDGYFGFVFVTNNDSKNFWAKLYAKRRIIIRHYWQKNSTLSIRLVLEIQKIKVVAIDERAVCSKNIHITVTNFEFIVNSSIYYSLEIRGSNLDIWTVGLPRSPISRLLIFSGFQGFDISRIRISMTSGIQECKQPRTQEIKKSKHSKNPSIQVFQDLKTSRIQAFKNPRTQAFNNTRI